MAFNGQVWHMLTDKSQELEHGLVELSVGLGVLTVHTKGRDDVLGVPG